MNVKQRFIPRDETLTRHVAYISAVRWADDESSAIILALSDGSSAVGTMSRMEATGGESVHFFGRWNEAEKWGWQFRFDAFVRPVPPTERGIVKRLTQRDIGLTEREAVSLWREYGTETLAALRAGEISPLMLDRNATFEGSALLDRIAEKLLADEANEGAKLQLFELFAGRGFGQGMVESCISRWGSAAPTEVKKNPFALMDLPSAGFKRCDRLYLDQGGDPAGLDRHVAAMLFVMLSDRNGHTWHDADVVRSGTRALIGAGSDFEEALDYARVEGLTANREDDGGRAWIASSRAAAQEQIIGRAVRVLSDSPLGSLWPTELPVSETEGDGLPSAHQRAEALKAIASPVGILCGSPGTGKSFVLAFVLRECIARYGEGAVRVCAPTGKAAVRASESMARLGLNVQATTIHRLLQATGTDTFDAGFSNPVDARFIVVDESSMIDTGLMSSLLRACQPGTHVLFIGDPNQLPPVGHGAPLRDMLASLPSVGRLTEIQRNAGRIVRACTAIREGEPIEWGQTFDPATGDNLILCNTTSNAESMAALESILGSMRAFDPMRDVQILTGLNAKSEVSRRAVNERMRKQLNPSGYTCKDNPFAVGDKVICLKNRQSEIVVLDPAAGYDSTLVRDAGYWDLVRGEDDKPTKIYVANGEIGRIVAVAPKVAIANFPTIRASIRIPVAARKASDEAKGDEGGQDDRGAGGDFDYAFAITVHKSQGSESPCIVVMADQAAGGIADANWHYTAISRASDLCIYIGPLEVIRSQCRRKTLDQRKTFLRERLAETSSDPLEI